MDSCSANSSAATPILNYCCPEIQREQPLSNFYDRDLRGVKDTCCVALISFPSSNSGRVSRLGIRSWSNEERFSESMVRLAKVRDKEYPSNRSVTFLEYEPVFGMSLVIIDT